MDKGTYIIDNNSAMYLFSDVLEGITYKYPPLSSISMKALEVGKYLNVYSSTLLQNAIGYLVEMEKRVSLFATKEDVFVIK